MSRRLVLALVTLAAATGGCGETPKLQAACTTGPEVIGTALDGAPAHVALDDGSRLSTCIARARSDSEIQNVGLIFTQVADSLSRDAPRSDLAATRLGYLIGAARRGASRTNGIHAELVRRLEQTPALDDAPAPRRRAFRRGLAAGRRAG